MAKETIRIGGASGFWGDSFLAADQLVEKANLDYLVFDYLAEITMSIMARARDKDPSKGYATDFVSVTMKSLLPKLAEKNIKVISNAGGVNPKACADDLQALIDSEGLNLKVAAILGDDILPMADELRAAGTKEMYSGIDMPDTCLSMNAYLGAFPIAEALAKGADIVVTGRGVDSAVTLGPCIHEFDWTSKDYDKLAGGSLAGHIIECGAQATGGIFTDWERVPGWEDIGYPIAGVSSDGAFEITKPEETGGLIEFGTIAEQMLYEIGDPQAYMLPDVVCDFSEVHIKEIGENRVRVSNAKGYPPTPHYKVSTTYPDGYRLGVYLTIGGIDAVAKARRTGEAVLKRMENVFRSRNIPGFTETSIEVMGAEDPYGPHARDLKPREAMLKLAAKHTDPLPLNMMLRELTSSGTSMAQGTTGMGGNRSRVSPVIRLFSFLIEKDRLPVSIYLDGEEVLAETKPLGGFDASMIERPKVEDAVAGDNTSTVPLIKLAYGRSGDKGNKCNVGVIARKPDYLPYIRSSLTADAVKKYFAHRVEGDVERFDLPGIHGLNFLMHEALGGGGIASLRNDPQGKAMAQILMDYPIEVPSGLVE